jgi:Ca2+-transporting ATPase
LVQKDGWYNKEVQEVFRELATSELGLSEDEAKKRLEAYGPNELEKEKRNAWFIILVNQLKNPLFIVLIAAALISFYVGKTIDTVVIFGVIILNTLIGFFQEYKAETALEALKSMSAPEAQVLRNCQEKGSCIETRLKAREIVPGDIIILSAGDKVPADARLFEAANLEIDESSLTGESTPVRKTTDPLPEPAPIADRINLVFSGTAVTNGRGKAIVFATAKQTEMGKIADIIKTTEKAETPIKKRTLDLSRKLAIFALLASGLTLVIGVLRGFDFVEIFLFSLATAVSAIPEGLPTVITLTLAIAVNRMAKRSVIIRKLQAVDTLGSATVICTDKTGTLTTNQMTAKKIFADKKTIEITGVGYEPTGRFEQAGTPIDLKDSKTFTQLFYAAVLCNDSRLRRHQINGGYRWEIQGDPTEGALIVAATKAGYEEDVLEEKMRRIDEIPFNSKVRYMVTFNRTSSTEVTAYCKGAPEAILKMCTKIIENGNEKELTQQAKDEILKNNYEMANEALRVLAFAYKTIKNEDLEAIKEKIQKGQPELIFIGLIGMIDPPRAEAKQAVELCEKAGIKVIMATGDHKLTAQAIAKELGIMKADSKVFTGSELDEIDDSKLDSLINEIAVFARVSPAHKYRIVESLRRKGHIVAMTGDGVNDAPGLKAAEIGIAMGITGTDVAKETADMVLTDDNFASIVNAIEEGRVIFDNIRKVVKYLISTNTGEVVTILAALILLAGAPLILAPVQILWINLVTDGLLVIPLALEAKEGDVMYKPPRKSEEKTINRDIVLNVIYVSAFMAIGTIAIFSFNIQNAIHAQTLAFATMTFFQVFNSLNCRSQTKSSFKLGIFTNRYLLLAIIASVMLQIAAISIPALQTALGTTVLSLQDWLIVVLISSSVLIADEVRKTVRNILKK